MAYTSKTQADLAKWWITGTGSVVNRLSEVMDDQADGPYYTVTAGTAWTASGGDGAEYYHTPTNQPDNVYAAGVKLTKTADDTCIDGGGGGLANGEWCWETGNSRVYVQLAAGDPDGVVMTFYYDWSNFMTEVVEDGMYRIHLDFEVGDGSTVTTLLSQNEYVRFDDGVNFLTKANMTSFSLGALLNDRGINGSYWSLSGSNDVEKRLYGTAVNIYSSILECRSRTWYSFYVTTITIRDSILRHAGAIDNSYYRFSFRNTIDIKNMTYENARVLLLDATPTNFEDVTVHNCYYGVETIGVTLTVLNIRFVGITLSEAWNFATGAQSFNIKNPKTAISSVLIQNNELGIIQEQYTINLHVTDKDGADVENAVVDLEGSDASDYDTDMWTAGTVTTAADGTITEQTITTRKWVGTSETLTNYNVFRMTISKAGYQTLTMENITIDSPIDWHVELQNVFKINGVEIPNIGNLFGA